MIYFSAFVIYAIIVGAVLAVFGMNEKAGHA